MPASENVKTVAFGGSGQSPRNPWSAVAFSRDLIAHPARYVDASLPGLPFPDGRFDLVLSSHFLFTYADRLDLEFHRAALLELHRVARRKVRVFPLLEQSGRSIPALLAQLLATLDIPHRIRRVGRTNCAGRPSTRYEQNAACA